MKYQILISTIDDNFLKRNYSMGYNHLIINQLVNKKSSNYIQDNLFTFKEKGLSKSRNKAIKYSNAVICLISDDDLEYKDNIDSAITEAFKNNPEADIITFQIEQPNGVPYKKYNKESFFHNKRTLMRVPSVEIAFRRKSIVDKKLLFDENFGLGSIYPTGEETIFLTDALDAGLIIKYVPLPIVIHSREGLSQDFHNNKYLIKSKGALFKRIFGKYSFIISFLFSLKKYNLSDVSFFEFLSLIMEGSKEYKINTGGSHDI
jgi:hypothetical protein